MSDRDSFIDEVTEEVRRDRLFALMRRYGWIAILAVLLLVGGAAWNEWRKAQDRAEAQALGDSILAALEADSRTARAEALAAVEAPNPGAGAVVDLLAAAERQAEDPAAAAQRLLALADNNAVEPVYRQVATLKALALPESGLTDQERRSRLDGLALADGIVGLLAEERIALLQAQAGETGAALERLRQVAADAGASTGLRRRAAQAIVALGGEPPKIAERQ
ncbi:tetratricopeptide repeat protein [Roseovarius salinarum]|uniref:tetratricopeptide repeat protein n=1 Tax=Roseovarius salinarum TaxID=1981892 RepID=UPI000C32BB88|nr:tetratricopeptide repeat protein [Roseovarius salinarum]